MSLLSIGQSASVMIEAKSKWNDTGIVMSAGQEYQITVDGRWTDWCIPCDANGYTSSNLVLRLTEWLRRAPRENWFALIGAIDRDERNLFKIGARKTLETTTGGVLTCFANDVPFMYWNNKGSVQLNITRTR